jgi:DNA-binding beta-propeller fold protein YncE
VTNITLQAALVNNGTGSLMAVNTATNKIYLGSNPTAVIDGATNTVTTLGAVAGNFYITNFAYNPVTNFLYVATAATGDNATTGDGTVTAINGTTGAATAITVGIFPTSLAVDTATNTILVTDLTSNQLTEINGATNVATNLPDANAPYAVAVNSATNQFYVANSGDNTVMIVAGPVVTSSGPTITAQPSGQTVATGSTVVFTAAVGGLPAPTLQWNLNSVPIAGANSATLVVSNSSAASAGSYTLTATNSSGTTTSSPAVLAVSSTTNPGRLINLSILSFIQGNLSMGFVTGGAGTSGVEPLLIRGVGPSIGPGTAFAVPGVMTDPTLTVVAQVSHATVASNSGWGTPATNATAVQAADAATGAFALTNTSSLDSAVVANLPGVGGGYSATVAGASGDNGWALTEVYDDTANYTPASTRLINLSCLTQIPTAGTLDVGFVIGGTTAKTVLVRVGGPALYTLYNIAGVLPDPQLQVSPLSNSATVLAFNAGWGGNPQIASVAASVGAYAFPSASSLDSAALVTLPPGPYTVQVSSKTGLGGTVLVEIYEVP